MMQRLKLLGLMAVLSLGQYVWAGGENAQCCAVVRAQLLALRLQMGGTLPEYHQLREEAFELGLQSNAVFQAMSRTVKGSWAEVLDGLGAITTNQTERLVVLYAGVEVGETNFIAKISQVADMVLSDKVTLAELKFYKTQCGIADHHAASSLVRRYQEVSISNLIMKLNAAGACPQGVSHIFSGEAKELYLDAVHDGLVGP